MEPKVIKLEGAEVLSVKLNAYPVEFKKEVKAKMKELGYNNYAKFTYKGKMFTSHEKAFIDIYLANKKPAYIEFTEDFLLDEAGLPTDKLGLTLVDYHSREDVADLKMQAFKDSLFNIDTLIKNPEILSKLDMIERIQEASS